MFRRLRRVVAWLVGIYLAQLYFQMGWGKFDTDGFWVAIFDRWNYPDWLRLVVGGLETAGGIMLLIPWLAPYGCMALLLVMGGAWGTRYLEGSYVDVASISAYMALLIWIAFEWWDFRWPNGKLNQAEPEQAPFDPSVLNPKRDVVSSPGEVFTSSNF